MKKIIWLGSFAVICLILAVVTSTYSLNLAKDAIEGIGTVSLTENSQEQIDYATEKYTDLSAGFGASIYLIDKINDYVDYEKLLEAQSEYISLRVGEIVELEAKTPEEILDEDITEEVTEIREIIDTYYPDENYDDIDQYDDFLRLEKLYAEKESV